MLARGAALLVVAGAWASLLHARQTTQQPVFRSALDVVTVDVSVRTGGTPVGGLTAKDFVLLDNGVRQTIDSVEMEEVPVDVSVLIDANEDVTMGEGSFHEIPRRISELLRPGDRMRVTTINGGVRDVVPASPVARLPSLARFDVNGLSSVNDGIASALLRSEDRSRRHLIVAITNGVDAMSTLFSPAVVEIARRSQAVLHIVQADVLLERINPPAYSTGRQRLDAARSGISGLRPPTRLFWRPYDSNSDIETLREASELTGGATHLPGLVTDAADVFRKVFDDYRRSYLLRYTPQAVARDGWHDIAVTVPAYPSYAVQARRGYMVEAAGAVPPPAKPASNWVRTGTWSIDQITEEYDRGNYARVAERFRQALNLESVVADFRKAGNAWPANPGREAVFVLELADAALHGQSPAARQSAVRLLHDHQKLVRHPLWPDEFERYWRWAVLTILQGVSEPEIARAFVDAALERFPDEPRFVLARALVTDQLRPFDASDGREGAAQPSHIKAVVAAYDAAIRFEDVAAEARVRKAWFLHRIGRHREALESLESAGGAALDRDLMMRYLRELFRGRVLEALDQHDAASAAYRAAQKVRPDAQSPRVALMRLAVRQGAHADAQAIADAVQRAPSTAFDPWWLYWLGDYRLYPAIIERLREQTR